jgi:hypothetical protein
MHENPFSPAEIPPPEPIFRPMCSVFPAPRPILLQSAGCIHRSVPGDCPDYVWIRPPGAHFSARVPFSRCPRPCLHIPQSTGDCPGPLSRVKYRRGQSARQTKIRSHRPNSCPGARFTAYVFRFPGARAYAFTHNNKYGTIRASCSFLRRERVLLHTTSMGRLEPREIS